MEFKLKPGDEVPYEVEALFREHQKLLAAGREMYAAADLKFERILEMCSPGLEVVLPADDVGPERRLVLVDRLADTNQFWVGTMAKQYAIEEKKIKPQNRNRKTRAD